MFSFFLIFLSILVLIYTLELKKGKPTEDIMNNEDLLLEIYENHKGDRGDFFTNCRNQEFETRTGEGFTYRRRKHQYKFIDNKIYCKLTEAAYNSHGEEFLRVKEGIVLKDLIRNRKFGLKKPEEEIKELEEEINWSELDSIIIKYFLIFKHTESFTKEGVKKLFFKEDVEKLVKEQLIELDKKIKEAQDWAANTGVLFEETSKGFEFEYPDNLDLDSFTELNEAIGNCPLYNKEIVFYESEIYFAKNIKNYLYDLLNLLSRI